MSIEFSLSVKIIMKSANEGVSSTHLNVAKFAGIEFAKKLMSDIANQFNDQRFTPGGANPKTIAVEWDDGIISINSFEFLGYALHISEDEKYE